MTDKQLTRICRAFRQGMLGKGDSTARCAMVSWALQGYLSCLGIETQAVEGTVGNWNHVWLVLDDGRVIDCTADQFNTAGEQTYPAVYIGTPLAIHQGGT